MRSFTSFWRSSSGRFGLVLRHNTPLTIMYRLSGVVNGTPSDLSLPAALGVAVLPARGLELALVLAFGVLLEDDRRDERVTGAMALAE